MSTGMTISEPGVSRRETFCVKDVSHFLKTGTDDSDHGQIGFNHVIECFDTTWYQATAGRDGFIRREAWIPHQSGQSGRNDCSYVFEIANCTSEVQM